MRRIPWPAPGCAGLAGRARLVGFLGLGLALALAACGDDGPTRAPFGLDQRPSNTTCLARSRPVIDTGVTLQRKWSGLTFNQPIYVTQAPGEDTWYVVERGGKVRAFADDATSNAQSRD